MKNRLKIAALGAAVSLAAIFYGCGKNKVIADLGSEQITVGEFEKRLVSAPPSYAKYLDSPQGRKQFLDLMVREKLVIAEAKKSGVTKSKEYKQTLSKYEADLKKRLADFKESVAMEIFLGKLHGEILNPSEQEIKKYYNDNKSDYDSPVQLGVSHILLLDEKTALEALAKIRRGESFEELAGRYSVDPMSSQRGGFLGVVKKGELAPELEAVARGLKTGAVSSVVKTEYGYHIIKKNSERLLGGVKYEEAAEDIRRTLVKTRLDDWVKNIIEKKKIKIDYALAEKAARLAENAAAPQGAEK